MSKIEKDNGYFVISPNILFDEYSKKIGRDSCFLYLYLLRRKGDKDCAFPSYSKIQEDLLMSRALVSKCIKSLSECGFIAKKRTASSNKYYINDKKLMAINLDYYNKKDNDSTDFELPEIDAEFKCDTTLVQNENSGSSNEVHEDRNKEDKNIKDRNKKGANAQPKKTHPLFIPTRDAYFKAFEAKTGYKPKWGGKEGRLLNEMLKRNVDEYGIMTAIKLYFSATDHFTLQQGYDAGYLFANIHKILNGATLTKEQLKQHESNKELHRMMVQEYGEDYAKQFA